MLVATVVGNRPQFVKAAAVSRRLRERHRELLIHTGQHHDRELSRVFFEELGVPEPDHDLGLGGGDNTAQTARMLAALGPVLREAAPDVVLVYGDTNSTLAAALAAAQGGLALAHVEAGMRSYDRAMPEEVNRVLSDHLADLLLCPSARAVENLRREGIVQGVIDVGDVMVDVAELTARAASPQTLDEHGLRPGDYLLVTAHRAGNVDDAERLGALMRLLLALPAPVVLPLHPRTRARLRDAGLLGALERALQVTPPLGPLEFAALLRGARAVLTDSGGVQKEAYLAGVPCVTLRDRTEWVETVQAGWNVLVDLDAAAALAALERPRPAAHPPLYGDGRAGERVVAALAERFD
ncbi:MAG TPA: UDP-N-acetylglucosamine 2-epimerase (non-hydrolyzing) [Solirubrobacteraceae bacterium]|nr:UDP-N-acetylglucosamine 2-epimerase (non-hydrolyzing) [Solirubrobacteraceae bacterium]